MNSTVNHILLRFPLLYRSVLRTLGSRNSDKLSFLALVKDGQCVFDIGANWGVFTMLFSHVAGKSGRVHAFEPVPSTFHELCKNVKNDQRYPNVVLNNCGIGDAAGRIEIHVPAGDFAQASLKRHTAASWAKGGVESIRCEIRTLDDYAAEQQIDRIDFVKIDIEGAELCALRGGQRVLQEFHPTIHLEFFAPWTEGFGYGARELITFLRSLGYEHFYDGDLTSMRSPVEKLQSSVESQNVVCAVRPLPNAKT